MKNGATINLESSWALNMVDPIEASTVLCGTKAGAQIKNKELILNYDKDDKLVEEIGGPSIPAVGFGMGIERVLMLLDELEAGECKLAIEEEMPEEPLGFQAYYNEPASLEELQESGLPELRDLPIEAGADEDDTL